uniref:MLO-like protein n=1 Tax=Rhizophora mucronata TaxID=61149 RepID=A0A2P2JVR3_RHIMU
MDDDENKHQTMKLFEAFRRCKRFIALRAIIALSDVCQVPSH